MTSVLRLMMAAAFVPMFGTQPVHRVATEDVER